MPATHCARARHGPPLAACRATARELPVGGRLGRGRCWQCRCLGWALLSRTGCGGLRRAPAALAALAQAELGSSARCTARTPLPGPQRANSSAAKRAQQARVDEDHRAPSDWRADRPPGPSRALRCCPGAASWATPCRAALPPCGRQSAGGLPAGSGTRQAGRTGCARSRAGAPGGLAAGLALRLSAGSCTHFDS